MKPTAFLLKILKFLSAIASAMAGAFICGIRESVPFIIFPTPMPAKNSEKEGLPSGRGLTIFPDYFADAVWTAGGTNSWLRAATQ